MIVRNGRKGLRSLLSLILAVNILLSLFPVGAYAEDIGTTEEPAAAVEAVAPEESAESEEADAEGDTAPAEEPEAAADAAETSDEAAPAAPAQEDADTPEQQTEEDAAGEDAAPAEDATEEPDAADESAELPEEAEDLANERPRLVARVGSIRSSLDQDAAHLTNFKVSDVVTGTAPWDADDEPGNDSSAANKVVRSFDQVSYEVSYETAVYGDQESYQKGYVWFRFELPCDSERVSFDTNSMGWMSTDAGYQWTLNTETINGQKTQVLTCAKRLVSTSGDEGAAVIPGMGTALVYLQVYGAHNGDEIRPTFYAWMDHNQGGDNYSWFTKDGAEGHDDTHDADEVRKVTPDKVTVSAAPHYNVQLKPVGTERVGAIDTFDFTTGNEYAANKDADQVKGQLLAYGVTLQLYGDGEKGLKGIEYPQGPITVDLTFDSSYTYKVYENEKLVDKTVDLGKENLPLLWSADSNRTSVTQRDGRDVATYGQDSAYAAAPYNQLSNTSSTDVGKDGSASCWKGGNWTATQDPETRTISLTVTDYEINPLWFPNRNSGGAPDNITYYDRRDGVKSCWKACFSAAEVFVVVPHKNLVERYGSQGSLKLEVKDVNFKATTVSGQEQKDKPGTNSSQRVIEDDLAARTLTLVPSGEFVAYVQYAYYGLTTPNWYTDVNNASNGPCYMTQDDATSLGSGVAIQWDQRWSTNGAADNTVKAVDALLKFDDKALELDTKKAFLASSSQGSSGNYNKTNVKFLYAYKPDGTGWISDQEQTETKIEDLKYSTTYDNTRTCVGILAQYRNPADVMYAQVTDYNVAFFKVKTDPELIGHVAQTSVATRWVRRDELWAKREEQNKQEPAATVLDNHETYLTEMPWMKGAAYFELTEPNGKTITDSFTKAAYTSEGVFTGGSGAPFYGDSLYLVSYKSLINNSVCQRASYSDPSDKTNKELFNLDNGEDTVDFSLNPTMQVQQGVTWNGTTTMTIVDTLPKGLIYVPGSSVYGGTYEENAVTGLTGTVTDGNPLKENGKSVWSVGDASGEVTFTETENGDGTTTLKWVITNVKVQEDVPSIYFKAIFDSGIKTNDSFATTAVINTTEDLRLNTADNGNLSTAAVKVSVTGDVALSQTLDPKFNEINTDLTWQIRYSNNSTTHNYEDEVMMTTLPHTEGTVGLPSSYHGTYQVSGFTVTPEAGKSINDYTVWYTTDPGGYSLLSRNLAADEVQKGNSGNVEWKQASVSATANDNGSYSVTDLKGETTAFVIIGPFSAQKSVGASLEITPSNNEAGDTYWNNVSTTNRNGTATVNVAGRVVKRSISGLVWYDDNRNGLRDADEKLVTDSCKRSEYTCPQSERFHQHLQRTA